jgi:UDP-N-acetyl-D-glucosamine dehydrogenase
MVEPSRQLASAKTRQLKPSRTERGSQKSMERRNGKNEPPQDAYDQLLARIEERTARVGIIGLGYVGLPLAHAFSRSGFPVLGFDVDEVKIDRLSRGESYVGHISDDAVREMKSSGFEAASQSERLEDVDAVLICVPTPLTESLDPDLSFVLDSVESIAARPRHGRLIVLESTTYPGTTRELVLPILEKNGLRVGQDFFLAFSPEREDPGNPKFSATNIPKVVGGIEPRSLELAAQLYTHGLQGESKRPGQSPDEPGNAEGNVVRVSSVEVAEACKILENTYRAVNIGLVNELKIIYDRMGINIWEVIEAAKTKPFGFQPFYPGPGLGGHCIPITPYYLTWVARKYGLCTRFVELAGEINRAMPAYVVERIGDALNDRGRAIRGSKITLLGMAYKKDVDDWRESPALELLTRLLRKGAIVHYNDPHIPRLPRTKQHPSVDMESQELTPEYLRTRDCVVIVTDHSTYDWEQIVRHSPLVVDTRNATRGVHDAEGRVIRA